MNRKTAPYKIIHTILGNKYNFYCELSGALVCTSRPVHMKSQESELLYVWNHDCVKYFNRCQKCGSWIIDAMYNPEVLECVQCAPYEEKPVFCKFCGAGIEEGKKNCPSCGTPFVQEGVEYIDMKTNRYEELEIYGFGPNVMKKTRICSKCGRATATRHENCPCCGNQLKEYTLYDWYKKMHPHCPGCNAVLPQESNYCPHCGMKIN